MTDFLCRWDRRWHQVGKGRYFHQGAQSSSTGSLEKNTRRKPQIDYKNTVVHYREGCMELFCCIEIKCVYENFGTSWKQDFFHKFTSFKCNQAEPPKLGPIHTHFVHSISNSTVNHFNTDSINALTFCTGCLMAKLILIHPLQNKSE